MANDHVAAFCRNRLGLGNIEARKIRLTSLFPDDGLMPIANPLSNGRNGSQLDCPRKADQVDVPSPSHHERTTQFLTCFIPERGSESLGDRDQDPGKSHPYIPCSHGSENEEAAAFSGPQPPGRYRVKLRNECPR